ncbi:MAG TPA: hypothetical protein VN887_12370 [Candidatus Angelobacter sp.]|nr:hypothetical protein [Candidatus Angelobacter sp.]
MKSERIFKNFSALSFDGNTVTGESEPAPSVSQPRLTPESVQDFDVHQDGSADADAPQTGRSGATRHWLQRSTLPVEFRQIRRRWLALPISRGCPGAE